MAMKPIWESDFHRDSYGFRPARSVHHSIRAVKLTLQDGDDHTAGRWITEGDLTSYFDTVHPKLLMGGVLSPLLSNIMLNEFDQWLENKYLSKKARKDQWYWNSSLIRPIAALEGRKWLPAVAYSRYADDFVVIVKGTKQQAEIIKEECRQFLETDLKLKLNLEKTASAVPKGLCEQ